MRKAFKEWAVVVDALGSGDQILVLRKGGISERPGGFQVDHPEFLLFPTLFHQQRESVISPAQLAYDRLATRLPGPDVVLIEYWARVADWFRIEQLDVAMSLRGQHIWRDEVIRDRYDWGRDRNIFVLALRVYRLQSRVERPMRPAYGGCKTWIDLEEDVDVSGATPVLSEDHFQKKLCRFHDAMAGAAPRVSV